VGAGGGEVSICSRKRVNEWMISAYAEVRVSEVTEEGGSSSFHEHYGIEEEGHVLLEAMAMGNIAGQSLCVHQNWRCHQYE
jgi:hypothetical protein